MPAAAVKSDHQGPAHRGIPVLGNVERHAATLAAIVAVVQDADLRSTRRVAVQLAPLGRGQQPLDQRRVVAGALLEEEAVDGRKRRPQRIERFHRLEMAADRAVETHRGRRIRGRLGESIERFESVGGGRLEAFAVVAHRRRPLQCAHAGERGVERRRERAPSPRPDAPPTAGAAGAAPRRRRRGSAAAPAGERRWRPPTRSLGSVISSSPVEPQRRSNFVGLSSLRHTGSSVRSIG